MERVGRSCFFISFSLRAISLKHQVMGCCCMAFACNTEYEGAVDPGSLQVQDQPGKSGWRDVCEQCSASVAGGKLPQLPFAVRPWKDCSAP